MSENSNNALGSAFWGAILIMIGGMLFLFYVVEPIGKKLPQWREQAYASLCIGSRSDGSLSCEKKMWGNATYVSRVEGAPVALPTGLGFDNHVIYPAGNRQQVSCDAHSIMAAGQQATETNRICVSRRLKALGDTINFTIADIAEWERLDKSCRSPDRNRYLCKTVYASHVSATQERLQLASLNQAYDELLNFFNNGSHSWENKVRLQGVEMTMSELYQLPIDAFSAPLKPRPDIALTPDNVKRMLRSMRV